MGKKKPTPTGPKIAVTEERRFGMHPRLLMDVIKRQAGTLCKAVLEGVMNGVDAGAPNIDVTLDGKQLIIADNGTGITDRAAIVTYWENFGQPPDEKEKKTFGYFRMGRGQLFAFGKNKWETGQFEMLVDINAKGLDYDLQEFPTQRTKGCKITIDLYEPLLPTQLAALERELRQAVKYVQAAVTFNDKCISIPLADVKWDHTVDGAVIKLQDSGNLCVYNLGVLVCSHPADQFGCGGDVVSTKQLKVNFARNEVMSDCPVWRKVKPLVDKHAASRISKKSTGLDDAGRRRIAEAIRTGTAKDLGIDVTDVRVLTDVTGRHWSIEQIDRWDWGRKITTAAAGDARGDRIHQYRLGFVLSDVTLGRFGLTLPELMTLLGTYCGHRYPKFTSLAATPYANLADDINEQRTIVPEEEWTPTERFVMEVISHNSWTLMRHNPNSGRHVWTEVKRRLILGASMCANGWTDGDTYIAIGREYIASTGTDVGSWAAYGTLLIHEYCHEEADFNSHLHGPEFYAKFHDWTRTAIGEFVYGCLNDSHKVAERVHKKVTAYQLRQQDKLAKAASASEKVMAAEATPPK